MNTGGGTKRKPKTTTNKKTTKPFRSPRPANTNVPRLMPASGTEKKVIFFGSADAININGALNTTGTIVGINLIQAGSSMFNRIGRRIQLKSVRLRCHLIPIQGATRTNPIPDQGRIAVIYDKQTNGALPVLDDLFRDTNQSGANTRTTLTGLNMNNRDRFISIIDKTVMLPSGVLTNGFLTEAYPDNGENNSSLDEYRKLNLPTYYKADSQPAVIGDIATGGLYFICFSAAYAVGTELYSLLWNCRIKYIDM